MNEQAESYEHQSGTDLRGSAASAGRRRFAVRLSPLTGVMAASVLTIVLLMGWGWQARQSYVDHKGTQKQAFPIGQLRGRIIYFDEVLTMSANMAAATGDPQWEKRYRQVEPELDAAIKRLRKLVPETFDSAAAIQTDKANVKLVDMENQVFELVGQGRLDEAQAILSGDDYREQKKLYSNGMERIAADLDEYTTADLESHRKRALIAIVSVLLGLPLVAMIWLWVLQNMRRYLKERDQAERALRESEERFRSLVGNIPGAVYHCQTAYPWPVEHVSEAIFEITGYHAADLMEGRIQGIGTLIFPEDAENVKRLVAAGVAAHRPFELSYRIQHAAGGVRWVDDKGQALYDADGRPLWLDGVILDVTESKQAERELRQIEWLLTKRPSAQPYHEEYIEQNYGDLTELNTSRLIMDSVGKEMLTEIASDYLDMLGTSSAIYEKNGDYALGIFASGWCKMLDMASRKMCGTDDDTEALKCGKWLCHESCWSDASKAAIEAGEPADIECKGGIRLYAVPIYAGKEVVGAINFGYGDPPKDPERLQELAQRYKMDADELRAKAEAYESRPAFMIEIAKDRLQTSARLIGAIVERRKAEDLLRESELNYRAIFNSVNDAIVVHDAQTGEMLEVNSRFCALFGYTAEEAGKLRVEDISEGNPPYSQAEVIQLIKSAAEGTPQVVEWMCKDKQCRLFWAEVNLKLVVLRGQKRVLAVIRDITERKRAEEKIADVARFPSENPGPVLRIARDGTLLYANDASGSILEDWGCREGQSVPDEWRGIISGVFETREEKKIEREHAGRVLSFMIVPVIEAGYANLYCRDTTERKRAEESLKLRFDLEELLTSISTDFISLEPDEIDDGIERALESIIDAVCVDRGYIFLYSTDRDTMDNTHEHCRRGVPPHKDRLQDVPVERFVWFDARMKRFETVAIDSVASLTEEAEAEKKEWQYEDIQSLLCVPMVFQDRLMGFVGFHTVLYETEWAEEIITFVKILGTVFANAIERKRAGQERERLLKTLAAKNEELQSIVYVASHDLKSPLVNIQGFSGELSRTCKQIEELLHGEGVPSDIQKELAPLLDEDIPESIGFIRAGTVKMQALLNGLLEVSRVGSAVLQIQALDMNNMMKHIIASMQFQITDSGAELTVDDLPGCIGDGDHVNQVFSNLLTNAVKYLDPDRKGEIHISGRAEGGESIYCVQDNGLGIAPQHQEKVFEIFHRLDPGRHAEGEGLGLTIALRILERHEGRIWMESEPGKGSKFFVSLPTA